MYLIVQHFTGPSAYSRSFPISRDHPSFLIMEEEEGNRYLPLTQLDGILQSKGTAIHKALEFKVNDEILIERVEIKVYRWRKLPLYRAPSGVKLKPHPRARQHLLLPSTRGAQQDLLHALGVDVQQETF